MIIFKKYAYDRRSSSDRSSDCRRNLEFVQAQNYRGWVETDKIACCTLDELKKWQETKRAVVTDARLTLAGTNVTLRMGTALPAKEESEAYLWYPSTEDDKGNL